jgi:hypothetical protein
MPSEEQ